MTERTDENMITGQNSDKQALGQFFTPPEVVSFIYDVLKVILSGDGKWTRGKYPSVIDPACGEGIFLKMALDKKFTRPKYVFGVDIDERAKQKWQEINLLKSFGSKAKMGLHFYHQNGLLPLPQKTLRYKKGGLDQYDLVIGNPPYGGVGLKEKITPPLENALLKFDLWRKAFRENEHPDLFDRAEIEKIGEKRKKRIEKFPIEILFIERFIQLTKSGGYIAIIIPDGVLANVELQYVRSWLFEKTKVKAIISLPRETFKFVGTTAKTSILFLQKLGKGEKHLPKQEIFMASAEDVGVNHSGKSDLPAILQEFQKFIHRKEIQEVHMSPHFTTIVKGTKNTLHRIDADYWNPKYTKLIDRMRKRYKIKSLGEFISYITYGVILVKEERKFSKGGIRYISPTTIVNTGLDTFKLSLFVRPTDRRNTDNRKPLYGDILFNRSGVGTLGRSIVFMYEKKLYTISDDVDIIRVEKISPFYICIFLKSQFGQGQIERLLHGVSGLIKISFEEIKSIQIPILPDAYQKKVENEYKRMSRQHDLAMEAKARALKEGKSRKESEQDPEYQKNIQKAEKMLDDLIKRTEEIIEGKCSDIY